MSNPIETLRERGLLQDHTDEASLGPPPAEGCCIGHYRGIANVESH